MHEWLQSACTGQTHTQKSAPGKWVFCLSRRRHAVFAPPTQELRSTKVTRQFVCVPYVFCTKKEQHFVADNMSHSCWQWNEDGSRGDPHPHRNPDGTKCSFAHVFHNAINVPIPPAVVDTCKEPLPLDQILNLSLTVWEQGPLASTDRSPKARTMFVGPNTVHCSRVLPQTHACFE